jgi:hypothetical protein
MDEEGNIGMYEAVNGEFKTSQGVREFIFDYNIFGCIETEPQSLTSIEYIESNEKQALITGYLPNQYTKVECDFEFLEGGQEQYPALFGAFGDSGGFGFYVSIPDYIYGITLDKNYVSPPFEFSYGRHTLTFSADNVIYDGQVYLYEKYPNKFFINRDLCLFGEYSSSGIQFLSKLRIYSFKIYEFGELILDCVPKKDSDGVVGLYDKISNTLLVSTTGENFIAGGEVSEGLNFLSYTFGFRRRLLLNVGD